MDTKDFFKKSDEQREEIPVRREDLPDWAKFQASLTEHPIVMVDKVLRYRANPISRWLCNHIDLNEMWRAFRSGAWSAEAFMQFYRDIGYSLGGFEEIWAEELDTLEESQGRNQTPDITP